MGSRSFRREGSGLRVEDLPTTLDPSSSKKIEDLQEAHCISFVHLKWIANASPH